MLIIAWLFDPIVFVRMTKWGLRRAFCWPCSLYKRFGSCRSQRRPKCAMVMLKCGLTRKTSIGTSGTRFPKSVVKVAPSAMAPPRLRIDRPDGDPLCSTRPCNADPQARGGGSTATTVTHITTCSTSIYSTSTTITSFGDPSPDPSPPPSPPELARRSSRSQPPPDPPADLAEPPGSSDLPPLSSPEPPDSPPSPPEPPFSGLQQEALHPAPLILQEGEEEGAPEAQGEVSPIVSPRMRPQRRVSLTIDVGESPAHRPAPFTRALSRGAASFSPAMAQMGGSGRRMSGLLKRAVSNLKPVIREYSHASLNEHMLNQSLTRSIASRNYPAAARIAFGWTCELVVYFGLLFVFAAYACELFSSKSTSNADPRALLLSWACVCSAQTLSLTFASA